MLFVVDKHNTSNRSLMIHAKWGGAIRPIVQAASNRQRDKPAIVESPTPVAIRKEMPCLPPNARPQFFKRVLVLLYNLREPLIGVETHLLALVDPVIRGGNELICEVLHRS